MSDTGIEAVLRRFVESLNAADWDAAAACLDGDVALDFADGRREIGAQAFRERLGSQARLSQVSIGDLVILTAPGGLHAALEFTLRGETLGENGRSFSIPAGLFLEVAAGRIVRLSERPGLFGLPQRKQ